MSDNEDATFFKLSRRRKKKRLKKMNRASVKCGTILNSLTHMQLEFQKKPENHLKKYELFLHI